MQLGRMQYIEGLKQNCKTPSSLCSLSLYTHTKAPLNTKSVFWPRQKRELLCLTSRNVDPRERLLVCFSHMSLSPTNLWSQSNRVLWSAMVGICYPLSSVMGVLWLVFTLELHGWSGEVHWADKTNAHYECQESDFKAIGNWDQGEKVHFQGSQ